MNCSRSWRASDYAGRQSSSRALHNGLRAEVGIIRKSALWRLCRHRHKRHGFATHALEAGVDLPTLGRMLGHNCVSTTMRYLHTTTTRVSAQISPRDRLLLGKPPADEPSKPRTT